MGAGLNLCKLVHECVCLPVRAAASETGTYWRLQLQTETLSCASLAFLCTLGRTVRNMLRDLSCADVHYRLCAFYCVIYSVCDEGKDVQDV